MKLSQDSNYIFNNNISIITGFTNNLRMIHIYMSVNAVKFLIEKRLNSCLLFKLFPIITVLNIKKKKKL